MTQKRYIQNFNVRWRSKQSLIKITREYKAGYLNINFADCKMLIYYEKLI